MVPIFKELIAHRETCTHKDVILIQWYDQESLDEEWLRGRVIRRNKTFSQAERGRRVPDRVSITFEDIERDREWRWRQSGGYVCLDGPAIWIPSPFSSVLLPSNAYSSHPFDWQVATALQIEELGYVELRITTLIATEKPYHPDAVSCLIHYRSNMSKLGKI